MNESKPRRTYLLLPDRFVSSIVHKYRRRQRKRADSGHHTNMTVDDIDNPRYYYYEQQERNNSHNNSFSYQNNNTSSTNSKRSNNNNNNNESYYSNNNSNVQSSRRSSLTTSSLSYDGENNDDNASLRSACSGMTPRTTASLAAESGMSVRLQHYQVGTPVSYALNINNDNESLCSTSSSSLSPSEPPFLSSSRPPPLPNSPSTLSSFPHRSNSNINETKQQHRQQRREERRSSFFRRRKPRIRQDSSNPSIANSWRIRRARASIEEDQPLPDFETQVFCATCEKWVQSRIRYRLGALTWLVAFILFLCTIVLFWVPFYVKYFKDVVHYCPACGTNIGRHTKL